MGGGFHFDDSQSLVVVSKLSFSLIIFIMLSMKSRVLPSIDIIVNEEGVDINNITFRTQ